MSVISLPLDRLPNVDKEIVLTYIRKENFLDKIAMYATDWRTAWRKDNLVEWLPKAIKIPTSLLLATKYIASIDNKKAKMLAILSFVETNFKYVKDKEVWKVDEHWNTVEESWKLKTGDCVANYEEVYTIDGIKKVGDLCVGDLLLSYDFRKNKTCYKPITKIWEKGELEISRVYLRNGQHIDITDNHPLWARINQQGASQYNKTYLKDIDLTRWWKRKLPIMKKVPYHVSKTPSMHEDLYFVIGHYIAEGWKDKSQVSDSGYALTEHIIPVLEIHEIPFTEYRNNSGVPCITFKKSWFKNYLRIFKENSFDINIPEEIFHLTENKIRKFLDGMYLGDGHNGNYLDKRGYISNKGKCYSTSSEQLAKDIQRLGLQIGESYHIWKQEKHGGVGKKPIWRITYNSRSCFLRDFGHDNLSEVSISYIEKIGKTYMRDFEVKDTHTFVFKNGLVSHQCEDGAIVIYALARFYGIPDYQMYLTAGDTTFGGHCYLVYINLDDAQEYPIDWCGYPSISRQMKIMYGRRPEYLYGMGEWFRFNCSGSWVKKF